VRINSRVVKEPGTKVEPDRERIEVRGRPIPGRSALRYLMMHKPVGFLTTLHDPEGRRTVRELMPPGPRMYPVGRLDADTSGLLLFTNDGELAHRLMHPRYGVVKTYRVVVDRVPDEGVIRRMRSGVQIERGEMTAPAEVRMLGVRDGRAALEVKVHEGRYRQVRRMCEGLGLGVRRLQRVGYGPLRLSKLPKGASRSLTAVEIRRLRATAARPGGVRPAPGPGGVRPAPRPAVRPAPRFRGVRPPRPDGTRPASRPRSPRPTGRLAQRPARPGFARAARPPGRPRRGPAQATRRTNPRRRTH
jgi:23S rRNA pseudouridine2605 synthase